MKKTLLSAAFGLCLGVSAVYAGSDFARFRAADGVMPQTTTRAPQKDGYTLEFCNSLYTWTTLTSTSNITYTCYIYVTPDIATQLAGNSLTSITFSSVIESNPAGLDGSVFVSEDINGAPVTSRDTKILNGYTSSGASMQTVALDTPYEIKEGTGFYYGYQVKGCVYNAQTQVADYPVAIDNGPANAFAGYVHLTNSITGTNRGTVDLSTEGCNMILTATTVGEKKDLLNVFSIGEVAFGNFTAPVYDLSEGMDLELPLFNYGTNEITSLRYSTQVNDHEAVEQTLPLAVSGNSWTYLSLPVNDLENGSNTVTLSVQAINGVDYPMTTSGSFTALSNGFDRKFVVEEGTGTWCGYCPRGIVCLDKMSERYPDRFIGIAVHSGDQFAVSAYAPLLSKYFAGLPSCIINRDPIYNVDPDYEDMETYYEQWLSQKALGDISLTVTYDPAVKSRVTVSTATRFALDESNAKYAIAFVTLEDGLTGVQTNNYAGGRLGPLDGWERKDSEVEWTYLDTARGITTCWGVSNSVPSTVSAGEEYTFERILMLNNVSNIANTSVVALLLNTRNGTIINACKVKAADYVVSGIADVCADSDAPAEYYNLQGMRMSGHLPAGVYLVKQGGTVTKTIIR